MFDFFLYFSGGIFCGIVILLIFLMIRNRYNRVAGIMEVDEKNNLCKIIVTSKELSNIKTKIAIFKIEHNVDLSREEQ